MSQDVLLWVGGVGAAVIGTLALILLKRVLAGIDRLDSKVTEQSTSMARIEGSVTALNDRVNRIDTWKDEVTKRELEDARERAHHAEAQLRAKP